MPANPINHQSVLNRLLNETVSKFARDYNVFDVETIMGALEDAKSDAPAVLADTDGADMRSSGYSEYE